MDKLDFAQYVMSLPERVLRSASALAGGLAKELGDVVVPKAVRRTHLYRSLVEGTLRFLIEQVGEVQDTSPPRTSLPEFPHAPRGRERDRIHRHSYIPRFACMDHGRLG